jgi:hypothetical protein
MRFAVYDTTTGAIREVRSAYGVETPEGIIEHAYGSFVPGGLAAIAIGTAEVTGKMVDVALGSLVDDPTFVPPEPPPEQPQAATE